MLESVKFKGRLQAEIDFAPVPEQAGLISRDQPFACPFSSLSEPNGPDHAQRGGSFDRIKV